MDNIEEKLKNSCFLDASTELDTWFDTARLRVPNDISVEKQTENTEKKFANRAGLNFISDNFIGTISIIGTGYAGQSAYGHIDYDYVDKKSKKGECAYAQIETPEQLIKKLDEFLDSYIAKTRNN